MAQHPFLPQLRGALRGRRGFFYDLSEGFLPGDTLHLLAPVAGHPVGAVLPVLGYCLSRETPDSPAYCLRAYVAPAPGSLVPFAGRAAARFEAGCHQERWLAGIQLYLTEIDLTDEAEALRLERPAPAVATDAPEAPATGVVHPLLYPSTPAAQRCAA